MEATFADAVVDALELQAAQSAIYGLTMDVEEVVSTKIWVILY